MASSSRGARVARGRAVAPLRLRTCFVAGTPVRVRDGYRSIEEIRSGDTVRAYDENTGELVWARVTETFVRTANEVHTLALEKGERIETTWSHRFYVIRAAEHGGLVSQLSKGSRCEWPEVLRRYGNSQ